MSTSAVHYLAAQELEERYIAPFVRRHFPFLPATLRPQTALVQPERAILRSDTGGQPARQPAQYSYTYVHGDGEFEQVVYILAAADGNILRVLVSR